MEVEVDEDKVVGEEEELGEGEEAGQQIRGTLLENPQAAALRTETFSLAEWRLVRRVERAGQLCSFTQTAPALQVEGAVGGAGAGRWNPAPSPLSHPVTTTSSSSIT